MTDKEIFDLNQGPCIIEKDEPCEPCTMESCHKMKLWKESVEMYEQSLHLWKMSHRLCCVSDSCNVEKCNFYECEHKYLVIVNAFKMKDAEGRHIVDFNPEPTEDICYQKLNDEFVPIGTLKRIFAKRSYNPADMTQEQQRAANSFMIERLYHDFRFEVEQMAAHTGPKVGDSGNLEFGLTILVVGEVSDES